MWTRCPECHAPDPIVLMRQREIVLTSYPVALDMQAGGEVVAGIDGGVEDREVLATIEGETTYRCPHCEHETDSPEDFIDTDPPRC